MANTNPLESQFKNLPYGNTPLHQAVLNADIKNVALFLSQKADPNILNNRGYTALDCCDPQIAQVLLKEDIPFDIADKLRIIRTMLLKAGAKELTTPKPKLPQIPKEIYEKLKRIENARLTPDLTYDEQYKLNGEIARIKMIFASQCETFRYIMGSELDKLATLDTYNFTEYSHPFNKLCRELLIYSNLDNTEKKLLTTLKNEIEQCWNQMDEILYKLEHFQKKLILTRNYSYNDCTCKDTDTTDMSRDISLDEIESIKKKYGEHNVLIEKCWYKGLTRVGVYEGLDLREMEILKEAQTFFKTIDANLKGNWTETLNKCQSKLVLQKYINYTSEANNFIKTRSREDVSIISLPFPTRTHKLFRLKKLSPADKSELDSIMAHTKPIILRNRLGYELIRKKMEPKKIKEYLSRFPTIKETFKVQPSESVNLSFVDLTKADDYIFWVNTIITEEERLKEAMISDPKFFNETPCMSACLLTKTTRGFAGGHQKNLLFPLYLALDIPITADQDFEYPLAYTAPTDINSPHECSSGDKLYYLIELISSRIILDHIQATYQLKGLNRNSKMQTPYAPFEVASRLMRHPDYKKPEPRRNKGAIPSLTCDTLIRETNLDSWRKNSYSEIIVTCNKLHPKQMIEGRLLLVDKFFLAQYKEKFAKLQRHEQFESESKASSEVLKSSESKVSSEVLKSKEMSHTQKKPESDFARHTKCLEALSMLTNPNTGRLKLALIDTDMEGFRAKPNYLEQFAKLESEISEIVNSGDRVVLDKEKFVNYFRDMSRHSLTSCEASLERFKNANKEPDPDILELYKGFKTKYDRLCLAHNQLTMHVTDILTTHPPLCSSHKSHMGL